MRVKLDENLPVELANILGRLGHETDTVQQEGWVFENQPVDAWVGCHVVVTGRKVRIRRP